MSQNEQRRQCASPPRSPRTEPYCWQSKAALRKIRENCENYATTLNVYVALTEIASNKASETFQATHEFIGRLAGVGRRTVMRRLHDDLERLGLISITTPQLKGPSTFTLLMGRCDIKSQRCDNERPVQSHSLEQIEEKKEKTLPSAGGISMKELYLEALAKELNHEF